MSTTIITIDGPGGSGKGTIGRRLAEGLGYHFLDSGAIYRGLAYAASQAGVGADQSAELLALAENLDIRAYPDPVLRAESIGELASKIAALPGVREVLLAQQRAYAQPPGLVADGRDMGTVVFPKASVKIFLTASTEERAKRRQKQLHEAGKDVNLSSLLEDIQRRDTRDSDRPVAPLEPAADAIIIDTTGLDINRTLDKVKAAINGS